MDSTIDVILHHYRARPGKFAHLQFGYWFDSAHKLADVDLSTSQSVAEAKRAILLRGYDTLDITPLVKYNQYLESI